MGQITTGIRSVLNHPLVYVASQYFFGRSKAMPALVNDFVRPQPDDKILDIGCGPADIMEYLPNVHYWGFDINPAYIARAKWRHKKRSGHFICKELTREDLWALPQFDIALKIGVLHHLDDERASALLHLSHHALKPGGRLITCDPCFEAGQHPLARCFISWDRGKNVRTREGYSKLISEVFPHHRMEIRHQTWLPYTLCLTECPRT
jgi:SAM-dependent methyltransferase